MQKFKVGDKVRVRDDLIAGRMYGTLTCFNDLKRYSGVKTTVIGVTMHGSYKLDGCGAYSYSGEMLEPVKEKNTRFILVTNDGTDTVAVERVDGKVVKKAKARLHPNDEYKWEIGRDLALNRLLYGTDYHPAEVKIEKKDEFYNGRVICVDIHNPANNGLYTVGKTYQFADGRMICDDGSVIPPYGRCESFREWKKASGSSWIEAVD